MQSDSGNFLGCRRSDQQIIIIIIIQKMLKNPQRTTPYLTNGLNTQSLVMIYFSFFFQFYYHFAIQVEYIHTIKKR